MFSWGGWSLVAKRPGQLVNTDEDIEDPPLPRQTDPALPLVTTFKAAPGSLPRLRYGTHYRLRAQLVDLVRPHVGFEQPHHRVAPLAHGEEIEDALDDTH